tara:strand:+ start:309 stop:962 length:654 start_codon:yes stop_codon:yes gene_type:complete
LLIHQIWLNKSPPPQHAADWINSCELLGEHKLWLLNDYNQIVPETIRNSIKARFSGHTLEGIKCASDFFRLILLLEKGGCYMDVDFENIQQPLITEQYLLKNTLKGRLNVVKPLPDRLPWNSMMWTADIGNKHLRLMFDVALQTLNSSSNETRAVNISGPKILSHVVKIPIAQNEVKIHNYPFVSLDNDEVFTPSNSTYFIQHQRTWRPRKELATID